MRKQQVFDLRWHEVNKQTENERALTCLKGKMTDLAEGVSLSAGQAR